MRWYILRALIAKEWERHVAERGGLVLALLLVAMMMLLKFFGSDGIKNNTALGGDLRFCFVDVWEVNPWVDHLRYSIPEQLAGKVLFRRIDEVPVNAQSVLVYPTNCGAIQVRTAEKDANGSRYKVWIWYPGADPGVIAPFEAWFWRETDRFFRQQTEKTAQQLGPPAVSALRLPQIDYEQSALKGGSDLRAIIAMGLVMMSMLIVCVYLLPSFTCEERERGILLAQALTPASPTELVLARIIFYFLFAGGLALLLAFIFRPAVLRSGFFLATLASITLGSLSIGLTISSLARTQRAASMAALCYMMFVALLLLICQQNGIPVLPWLFLEYHGPRLMQAILDDSREWYHPIQLAWTAFLAGCWALVAMELFRRRGWQ